MFQKLISKIKSWFKEEDWYVFTSPFSKMYIPPEVIKGNSELVYELLAQRYGAAPMWKVSRIPVKDLYKD